MNIAVRDTRAETNEPPHDFLVAEPMRPHPLRRRAILAAHPEVAKLFVTDPLTAVITLAVVVGQTAHRGLFRPSRLGLLVADADRRLLRRRLRQPRDVRRHPRRGS